MRQWGAERRVSCAQTRERGPPSALAEYFVVLSLTLADTFRLVSRLIFVSDNLKRNDEFGDKNKFASTLIS